MITAHQRKWRPNAKGRPDLNTISTVSVEISVVLGKSTMPMHQLLRMGRGAVIELETEQNEEVYILANNIPIAMADVVINGDRISVVVKKCLQSDGLAGVAA